ncbi:hypothetical protein I4641_00415 [Waterburya agarophytonicola K14]|uniref:Uncharacterized protein n=1 Tax=Waterburya agarophytonicola KI4 TaxID=2874699 RepID=A0A964BL78_9CYAN|nr:hypothetical protein [Waterburya agarophytonicola]MCC0175443.1 hypothetical protein [Waterburya agarophytonicola KI4]
MGLPAIQNQTQKLSCPRLPLAVYREVSAHLRQVTEVEASLIVRPTQHDPQAKFDYYQSQVAALQIQYGEAITDKEKARVTEILDYYAQRYSPWEVIS